MKNQNETVKMPINFHQFRSNSDLTNEQVFKIRNFIKTKNEEILSELLKLGVAYGLATHNIVAKAGRIEYAKTASGQRTTLPEIDWGAFGNGAVNLDENSLQLTNEVFRLRATDRYNIDDVACIEWNIKSDDVGNQTFTEFISLIDGTEGENTGVGFSVLSGINWIKSGSLFIAAEYGFSNP